MYFLIESIFVGLYLLLWYKLISLFVNNFYSALWISGFFKHFFGFYIGLHDYFCQYGDACQDNNLDPMLQGPKVSSKYYAKKNIEKLFITSIIEGVCTVILGYFIGLYISNKLTLVFTIGVLLHLLFEFFGIHRDFCKKECGFLHKVV